MKLIEAMEVLKKNCEGFESNCKGCIFYTVKGGCYFYNTVPEDYDVEEIEKDGE